MSALLHREWLLLFCTIMPSGPASAVASRARRLCVVASRVMDVCLSVYGRGAHVCCHAIAPILAPGVGMIATFYLGVVYSATPSAPLRDRVSRGPATRHICRVGRASRALAASPGSTRLGPMGRDATERGGRAVPSEGGHVVLIVLRCSIGARRRRESRECWRDAGETDQSAESSLARGSADSGPTGALR
jgi:hypothetical protein